MLAYLSQRDPSKVEVQRSHYNRCPISSSANGQKGESLSALLTIVALRRASSTMSLPSFDNIGGVACWTTLVGFLIQLTFVGCDISHHQVVLHCVNVLAPFSILLKISAVADPQFAGPFDLVLLRPIL